MKAGAQLGSVYMAIKAHVAEKRPELSTKLPKSLGFVMGIEYKESALSLTEKVRP